MHKRHVPFYCWHSISNYARLMKHGRVNPLMPLAPVRLPIPEQMLGGRLVALAKYTRTGNEFISCESIDFIRIE